MIVITDCDYRKKITKQLQNNSYIEQIAEKIINNCLLIFNTMRPGTECKKDPIFAIETPKQPR